MKKTLVLLIILSISIIPAFAGLDIVRSSGITLTGTDGVRYIGTSGIALTGADGFPAFHANGITLTGADGITLTGADGVRRVGSNGVSYTGPNGITLTGADGITLTGADGITLTGADGITLTGADGKQYRADSIIARQPNGITLTGADGITLTGADGITLTGADGTTQAGPNGVTLAGADGITLTGADGSTLTSADSITGFNANGVVFDLTHPNGITLTGADGITLTGADGISITQANGIVFRNLSGITLTGADGQAGLQSVDPDLAVQLNDATDDSSINAVVVFHNLVTDADVAQLQQSGIQGGTRFRQLPMVYVSGTKSQILAVSHLASVRSIYGNRTLTFNSDPYFKTTGLRRVPVDQDLTVRNGGMPVSGRSVTVAVLDTGINTLHSDLNGKVVQNVRLADTQSSPATFLNPVPVENVVNSDLAAGHGTFVSGIIAGTGSNSGGKYNGVAPGAKLLGLSAGDVNLTSVLSGFDYLLEKGGAYGVRVVNCSFSADTVFDYDDPVNIATKMLTDRGVNVVFSAGNAGPGDGSLNPYAMAPWVIGVGATDENGVLAGFSSRGAFGGELDHPTLVAPGVNVASLRNPASVTAAGGIAGADSQRLTPGELPYYTTASGTSFSAPQVAGAIALMLEANPGLRPTEIKDILTRTATPLPHNFYHEVGAGMLNTYAAVLEAAFPTRRMGAFRSTLSANSVRFETGVTQEFLQSVSPGQTAFANITLPANTIQSRIGITWGLSGNDFGLKLYDAGSGLVGESNYLNLPGLSSRHEEIVLRNPLQQTYRAAVQNTLPIGTSQNVYGTVESTRVSYPQLTDLSGLSGESLTATQRSLITNIILPDGNRFRPDFAVSRFDLATVFVRGGFVPQYVAGAPMFTDVKDNYSRNSIESAQSNPNGKLFYDVSAGERFYPNTAVSRLTAAIAFVKAANLDSLVSTATLSPSIADGLTIPAAWRGYAAVALQKGFMTLDGNRFNASRSLTRLELARAVNSLLNQ